MLIEDSLQDASKNQDHNISHPLNFIAAGVACYAFSLLDSFGLIDIILESKCINKNDILSSINPLVIESACATLEKNNILLKKENVYVLTKFGAEVAAHRGSIGLIYNGYRNILSNQCNVALNTATSNNIIDDKAIVNASIHFGKHTIDPLIINIIDQLNIQGSICDLGCGDCTRLIELCKATNVKGLGIELSHAAIEQAKIKLDKQNQVVIIQDSIETLTGHFPEVEILMQFFVMHDFASEHAYLRIMKSFSSAFPNLKYFLYADVVSPSLKIPTQLPGFDYVHALLGITPKTHEETLSLFEKSNFSIAKEIKINQLNNTFLWILQPKPIKF